MEQKIFFTNKHGNTLCGMLHKPKKYTEKCILLCHGITVNKDEEGVFTDLANELVARDFAVLRFDFRGHGESEGSSVDMTPMGETQDVDSAITFLHEQGFREFGIVGASFGGGVAVMYAAQHPSLFHSMVLMNPLLDYDNLLHPDSSIPQAQKHWLPVIPEIKKAGVAEVGSRKFKIGKDFLDEISYLKPWQSLDDITCPILFVHGTEDAYVPYSDSVKFSKMFEKKLITIEGGTHGFHGNYRHEEEANRATVEFLMENM